MASIGFIGLGVMGAPMATHLLAAGHTLHAHSRSGVPAALENAGAKACARPADVARAADVVITMLPNTPDVEAVLFGTDGVAAGLSAGKLVIDMSSIDPVATRGFAERVRALGCGWLDAPVSGGEVGAKAASLSIMVGGEPQDVERALPFLSLMGKKITHVGGAGDGQTCKVANQIVVALNIAAVAEAVVFAKKLGADPQKVCEALQGGFASSRVLEVHSQRMIQRTFAPGFRIRLHQKDLDLALRSAKDAGAVLQQTAGAAQLFAGAAAQGLGDADHSAVVQVIELLNGIGRPAA